MLLLYLIIFCRGLSFVAEFSELIKNFNKIRDFMRDFYIYGFKTRDDFAIKSARTYDNEKRRCESYLGNAMKWSYADGNKISFISADCGTIPANPLYSAWKSKSFTTNDIMLHFYILDALQTTEKAAEEFTEQITQKSGKIFDLQTVRGKCNEYVDLGILSKEKKGKKYYYKISKDALKLDEELIDAIKFFQSTNLGIIGNYILDNINCNNDLFIFKHHYIVHTLEDGILYDILTAMREHKKIEVTLIGSKSGMAVKNTVVPVKILCSYWSGRRYLCAFLPPTRKFSTFRLDAIKSVASLEQASNYSEIQDAFLRNINKVWGVSFKGESRNENEFSLTLHIDEIHEKHIISRIKKEGRDGVLERIADNTFKFTKKVFDANEAMPWIKTFIGRIISFEASDWLKRKLNTDIRRMSEIYGLETQNE